MGGGGGGVQFEGSYSDALVMPVEMVRMDLCILNGINRFFNNFFHMRISGYK